MKNRIIESQSYLDGDAKKPCNNILYKTNSGKTIVWPLIVLRDDFDGTKPTIGKGFKIDKLWLNNNTRKTKDVTKDIRCTKEKKSGFIIYKILYKDILIRCGTTDFDYSIASAIDMFLNGGILFQ